VCVINKYEKSKGKVLKDTSSHAKKQPPPYVDNFPEELPFSIFVRIIFATSKVANLF
jgi:hypothetical protein